MSRVLILSFTICQLLYLGTGPCCRTAANETGGGSWKLLKPSIGMSAMHMQLLTNDRVVIFDLLEFGPSNITLPPEKCRPGRRKDCTAHSVEYDVVSNTVRPLKILTNTWCSSGVLMPDGRLIQTGGFNQGDHVVRIFQPCDTCDWEEIPWGLNEKRWYSTNHLLPDGRQIIVGGLNQSNYEFYPKIAPANGSYSLPFLNETKDSNLDNLYPFVFLNVDGNLFIFANNRAILFDYVKGVVVKTYPTIPGGDPRCYPSTGSAVLLPLRNLRASAIESEVLVCGGAPLGAVNKASYGQFVDALNTCGRIKINDPNAQWVMETMPMARVMGDMLLLPNGEVLIINGASAGAAGWEFGRNPVLSPLIYQPDNPIGNRFRVETPSSIARMYHSTAVLLRDGRVLVSGGNAHKVYNFTTLYPTDLSLEAFLPSYLNPESTNLRPTMVSPNSQGNLGYGKWVPILFKVTGRLNGNLLMVTMIAPSFNTHSFSMNQRMLILDKGQLNNIGESMYELWVVTPGSGNLAPSGYYLLYVVHQEIPSEGIWVHIQ